MDRQEAIATAKLLKDLISVSEVSKILGTFIKAFEKNSIKKEDGIYYLHGNFNLNGTVSGRLSSSGPNLQNLPSGSKYAKIIKRCFYSPKGKVFLGADFNSLEDYISALTTKDPNKLKVYLDHYDGHCLRAYAYFKHLMPDIVNTVDSINSIKHTYPHLRQESKIPTFALTYQGTWATLVKNIGLTREAAMSIEDQYHKLYKVSDDWVASKLEQATKDGYVTVAFGLRVRTPILAQTLLNKRNTPNAAGAEGRTAGNALGQSYGLLNNRAANEFMQRVHASKYKYKISPIALIHDAIYLITEDSIGCVEWVNRNLVECMEWQELEEIKHGTVKLGAEIDIFPTWDNPITIPNRATKREILMRVQNV